ncbi:MAG: helix-turn-helix domain-containing protein [Lachnospiraceae bacterium]|nr:helix-turn-helix domain-containing protein [Lachnospiraceae bacterium]
MSILFEDLRDGLQEAIKYEQGIGTAKSTTITIAPVKKYSNVEIRSIRNKSGMTQAVFADFMGVSRKTVEAWELGRTHPTGPAYRLLDILAQGKQSELSFVTMTQASTSKTLASH